MVALFHEINDCFSTWNQELARKNLLNEKISRLKDEFHLEHKKLVERVIKNIRNSIGFHAASSSMKPKEFIEMFEQVDKIKQNSINQVLKAAREYGTELVAIITTDLGTAAKKP